MFTVAVVGAGGMGRTHLNNLQKMEDVKMIPFAIPTPMPAHWQGTFRRPTTLIWTIC